jgi:hypothetical protein
MLSEIASALSNMRSDLASSFHAPTQLIDIGNVGSHFAMSTISSHSYLTCQNRSQSSKFLRHATEAEELHPMIDPSELVPWMTPYVRCARASSVLGPNTYEKKLPVTYTFVSNAKFGVGKNRTIPQHKSNPFLSKS